MRWSLSIAVLCGLAGAALAKPKVAVAPLDGDDDGLVTAVVAEEAAPHAKVTGPRQVQKTLDTLHVPSLSTARSVAKVRRELAVDAVIHGRVVRDHGKKRLELDVAGRGKKPAHIELAFKKADSKTFRKALREELGPKIEATEAEQDDPADRDDPDDRAARADRDHRDRDDHADRDRDHRDRDDHADRDRRDRDDHADRDRHDRDDHADRDHDHHDRDRGDHDVATRDDRDDDSRRVRARSDDDDDSVHRHHRHHRDDDDEAPPRHPVTQAALWLDAGGAGLHRTLTYQATGNGAPPAVGTGSFSAEIDGEVYPGAFSSLKGPGAGFGFAAAYGKTLGLAIQVPGTTASAPIDESHYELGVRYRFVFGQSSIAAGISYWARRFVADRSALGNAQLDMPDVDYKAVAPGAIGKFALSPTLALTIAFEVPLMYSSGEITSSKGFRAAQIYAVSGFGGLDFALARNYGLRVALVADQVMLSFNGASRGVTAATDRTLGALATFALLY